MRVHTHTSTNMLHFQSCHDKILCKLSVVTHIVKRNIHVLKIVEDDRLVVGVLLGMEHFTWHYKT